VGCWVGHWAPVHNRWFPETSERLRATPWSWPCERSLWHRGERGARSKSHGVLNLAKITWLRGDGQKYYLNSWSLLDTRSSRRPARPRVRQKFGQPWSEPRNDRVPDILSPFVSDNDIVGDVIAAWQRKIIDWWRRFVYRDGWLWKIGLWAYQCFTNKEGSFYNLLTAHAARGWAWRSGREPRVKQRLRPQHLLRENVSASYLGNLVPQNGPQKGLEFVTKNRVWQESWLFNQLRLESYQDRVNEIASTIRWKIWNAILAAMRWF